MTANLPSPLECLLPLIAVMAGFAVGVIFVVVLPTQWQEGFDAIWYPRWMGLAASMILWAIATIVRGRSLHCGGLQDLKTGDRLKYGVGAIILVVVYTGLVVSYVNALPAMFMLTTFLLITIFISEIGWGDPFHGINVFTKK